MQRRTARSLLVSSCQRGLPRVHRHRRPATGQGAPITKLQSSGRGSLNSGDGAAVLQFSTVDCDSGESVILEKGWLE